jgi:hypothetical protein
MAHGVQSWFQKGEKMNIIKQEYQIQVLKFEAGVNIWEPVKYEHDSAVWTAQPNEQNRIRKDYDLAVKTYDALRVRLIKITTEVVKMPIDL